MSKQWLKSFTKTVLLSCLILSVAACNQSPIRNPFAGRSEPKLAELPALTGETAPAPKTVWTNGSLSKQERFTKIQPCVAGNIVYAADHSGKLIALNRDTGKKLWSRKTKKAFSAGPAFFDQTLFLTTQDAKVIAFDATNGKQKWEAKVSSEVLGTPAVRDGVVVISAIDGSVTGLSTQNGNSLWTVLQSTPSLSLRYSSAPVIAGEKALVGLSSGKLLAINLQNGLIEWERVISLPRGRSELQRMVDISADPILNNDVVYVITYQGKLAAVEVSSGNLIWERDISSYQNMASDPEHLFITDNDRHLWAIDKQTGTTFWKQLSLADRYITGPAVVDDKLVVGDRGGFVHFIQPSNGQLLSRAKVVGKSYQAPISMGNEAIIMGHNGKLVVIR
ncbi:MAG: outer membrane protein assembly factor BamB [Candidatus Berkiellales bacterium]